MRKAARWFWALDQKDQSLVSQLLFFVPSAAWLLYMDFAGATYYFGARHLAVSMGSVCQLAMAVLAVREVLFARRDLRTLAVWIIGAFMAYMAYRVGELMMATGIVVIVSARNVPLKRFLAVAFAALAGMVVFVIASSQLGVITDAVSPRGDIVRHALGFAHPNTPCEFTFFALCLWVCLRGRRFSFVEALLWAAALVGLYLLTDSRTSVALGLVLVALAFILRFVGRGAGKADSLRVPRGAHSPSAMRGAQAPADMQTTVDRYRLRRPDGAQGATGPVYAKHAPMPPIADTGPLPNLPKQRKRLPLIAAPLVIFVPVCAAASLVLTAMYDPSIPWMQGLGSLTARLSYGNQAMQSMGVHFLSHQMVSTTGAIVDCGYVHMLLDFGMVYTAIALVLATAVSVQAFRQGNWQLLVVVALLAVHAMLEIHAYTVVFNPLLVVIGGLFYAGYRGFAPIDEP